VFSVKLRIGLGGNEQEEEEAREVGGFGIGASQKETESGITGRVHCVLMGRFFVVVVVSGW
jgi:hypothetical protein